MSIDSHIDAATYPNVSFDTSCYDYMSVKRAAADWAAVEDGCGVVPSMGWQHLADTEFAVKSWQTWLK